MRYPKEWPGVLHHSGSIAEIVELYDYIDNTGEPWICTRGIDRPHWDLINLPAFLWKPLTQAARELLAAAQDIK